MSEKALCQVLLWRRPAFALLFLACGSLVWYFCGPLQRSVVSLISDVLFTLVCAFGLLGYLCRQLHISIPVDPLEWQVSTETANDIAACVANTVGAAESVLRVAASGRDSKFFTKVVLVLYLISVIGRTASGATVAYAGLWLTFLVPLLVHKLAPQVTSKAPHFLQKKFITSGI